MCVCCVARGTGAAGVRADVDVDYFTSTAMTGAQSRLAETIETFYGAADRTSDGALAGHAFKNAVQDLDAGIQRELVRVLPALFAYIPPFSPSHFFFSSEP